MKNLWVPFGYKIRIFFLFYIVLHHPMNLNSEIEKEREIRNQILSIYPSHESIYTWHLYIQLLLHIIWPNKQHPARVLTLSLSFIHSLPQMSKHTHTHIGIVLRSRVPQQQQQQQRFKFPKKQMTITSNKLKINRSDHT